MLREVERGSGEPLGLVLGRQLGHEGLELNCGLAPWMALFNLAIVPRGVWLNELMTNYTTEPVSSQRA